ncbi:MAG TPA: hypothetical protein DIT43_02775 [Dehalococcoidia bacterium]|nr:hypothetical protein [Dehalococcoidia bacterium]
MYQFGLVAPFWLVVLLWVARIVWLSFICTLLAWLGIRALDAMTPHIYQRQRIGESPVATGLFIAGFFILVGLVIHGAVAAPAVFGGPLLQYFFDFRRLGLLAVSFVVSLLIGIALFYIVDKLTPKIPFASINDTPVAVGIYVFGYLVFFGLILHAALVTPL